MCGICGFTGQPQPGVLQAMADVMVHRGPDDAGLWADADISLGMRRLAIVDLATGQQPVQNEDGTVWAVFNGEIYNHPELRAELTQLGHRFRTDHSDTEVLVHLYEELGPDYLHRLNGMFAIALWDAKRGVLHLARDRAGIKPLYFANAGPHLIFASEIKSLLANPAVSRAPNFQALHHYFSFKNVPAPWTAFEGIEQLGPGERAVFRDGQLIRDRWWRLQLGEPSDMNEADAAARIRELLTDSVRLHMRSDVPFGAYLSGGLDSSSVVALMCQLGARRVNTFSLTYEEDFQNKTADREFALRVSRMYGTEHHEYVMSHGELVESAQAVIGAFDEPFSGVTSTYFLTRMIAQHVKVALSGDGADELFASYLPHRLAQPLQHYRQMVEQGVSPGTQKHILAPYGDQLGLLGGLAARGDEAAARMAQYLWDESGKLRLYSPRMRAAVGETSTEALIRDLYQSAQTSDPLNRALWVDFETLLPDQVLAFVDRLSMAHSVEVRPPFLDYRLMELAGSLPGSVKIKAGRVKHILKEAVRGLIPDEIVERPKEGFVLPVNDWLSTSLGGYVGEVLAPHRLALHGLLEPEVVAQLVTEHAAGAAHGARVWNLM
ncbi:MAG TPA: asparagine synthase (glutamine-hydrolyzing), partial [Chloroflexota bacterium]